MIPLIPSNLSTLCDTHSSSAGIHFSILHLHLASPSCISILHVVPYLDAEVKEDTERLFLYPKRP